MEALSIGFLLKALLRVGPSFAMMQGSFGVPLYVRLLFSLPLALILSQRLQQDGVATITPDDLLLGMGIGAFLALFFAASMKVSLFFAPVGGDEAEESPWRKVIDSFFFIFILMIFMALKLERNLLELLAMPSASLRRMANLEVWSHLLTDLTWLAIKMSSFGFLLMLTKTLFEEIYRRLGGESLRLVFSCCLWLALIVMSPLLFPSFSDFVSAELSQFWRKWLGVSL